MVRLERGVPYVPPTYSPTYSPTCSSTCSPTYTSLRTLGSVGWGGMPRRTFSFLSSFLSCVDLSQNCARLLDGRLHILIARALELRTHRLLGRNRCPTLLGVICGMWGGVVWHGMLSTYSLTYYTVRAVCSYMARNVHPYAHVTYVLHDTLRVFIHGT